MPGPRANQGGTDIGIAAVGRVEPEGGAYRPRVLLGWIGIVRVERRRGSGEVGMLAHLLGGAGGSVGLLRQLAMMSTREALEPAHVDAVFVDQILAPIEVLPVPVHRQ